MQDYFKYGKNSTKKLLANSYRIADFLNDRNYTKIASIQLEVFDATFHL